MKHLRIDPDKPENQVTIFVNGIAHAAYQGESLMAALTACGFKALRKSWKNAEPRGALCGMGVCYECRVTVNGMPDQRACITDVEDGMRIELDEA
ncbi:(2Fe-2S)-binding protein [Thermodesulfobacteriota bacterium]